MKFKCMPTGGKGRVDCMGSYYTRTQFIKYLANVLIVNGSLFENADLKWLSLILILFVRCLLKKEGILHDNGHVHVILTVVAKQRNFTVVPSQPTQADAWSSNEIMAHTCKKSKLQHIPARRWRRRIEFTCSWNQQLHI